MNLKTDLQRWYKAIHAFDHQDYHRALDIFLTCHSTSKAYFNIGVILTTLHHHQHALNAFTKAIELDPYFSAAYFQSGVSNILLGNIKQSIYCFDNALKNLRGNKVINYRQIGLDFSLYSCEILYNRGMCQIYLGELGKGMDDLRQAQLVKMNHQHDIIDKAVRNNGQPFYIYSIPPSVIYRLTDSQLHLLDKGYDLADIYKMSHRAAQKIFHLARHHYCQYLQHSPYHSTCMYHCASAMDTNAITALSTPLPSKSPIIRKHQPQKQQHESTFGGKGGSSSSNNAECIKVKLHYDDTRIMLIPIDTSLHDLRIMAYEKLDLPLGMTSVQLFYKNEAGVFVPIINDTDWLSAKMPGRFQRPRKLSTTSNTTGAGNIGKVELWCRS